MPKVTVSSQTSLDQKASFEKVCQMLENDSELRKLDPQYKCDFDAEKLSGTAKGQHFKAAMSVNEGGSGSQVEIIVDLPLHLALAKGMVAKTLQKKLDAALA